MPTIEELQNRIAELEAEVARLKVQPLPPEAAHLVNAQRRMAEAEMRYNMLAKERLGMEERIAKLQDQVRQRGYCSVTEIRAEVRADERRKVYTEERDRLNAEFASFEHEWITKTLNTVTEQVYCSRRAELISQRKYFTEQLAALDARR